MNSLQWFSGLPRASHIIIALLVTAIIGYVDYRTGFELRLEIFYLLPISYATWFLGQRIGILFSVLSIMTIAYSDIMAGKKFTHFTVEIWNGAMYLVFYVIVTVLLKLRISMQQRENLLEELDAALRQNQELSEMLPLCGRCKKLRNDREYRERVEAYIDRHKGEFIQSLCTECASKRL